MLEVEVIGGSGAVTLGTIIPVLSGTYIVIKDMKTEEQLYWGFTQADNLEDLADYEVAMIRPEVYEAKEDYGVNILASTVYIWKKR